MVGLPLNMDGTEQDLTLRAKKFANRLNGRFGIKVELQDERLTAVSARDEIFQRGWLSRSPIKVKSMGSLLA